jgi:hydroxymethylglutaryl-CoA lyase
LDSFVRYNDASKPFKDTDWTGYHRLAGLGPRSPVKGATGNVATEDVVYLLKGLGCDTGVDLGALLDVAAWIKTVLGRAPG